MKKLIYFLICFISSYQINAQKVYVDPTVTGAVVVYAGTMKSVQDETNKKLNRLEEAQLVVAGQLAYINDIQNKVYKGMSEVNNVIKDGLALKRAYKNIEKTVSATQELTRLAGRYPEYLIFTTQQATMVKEKAVEIGTDLTSIVTSGGKNLMTSGDRQLLISKLESDTYLLYVYTLSMRNAINRAVNVGFWRRINPFQGYINTDKDLFQNTMRNAGLLTR